MCLEAKLINFWSENSDLLYLFFFYFLQELSNPVLFAYCCCLESWSTVCAPSQPALDLKLLSIINRGFLRQKSFIVLQTALQYKPRFVNNSVYIVRWQRERRVPNFNESFYRQIKLLNFYLRIFVFVPFMNLCELVFLMNHCLNRVAKEN